MVVREWQGRAEYDRRAVYPAHFHERVLPELRGTPGFLGVELLIADHGSEIEFKVMTRWESMDAIRSFAGDNLTKAVVEPGAIAALIDFDDQVTHYTLLESFWTMACN